MKNKWFHKAFKLNGNSFSHSDDIIQFSKNNLQKIHPFLVEWFSDDNFVQVQTSGSTGIPKNIKLQKEQMQNSALATGEFFKLYENTTALLCLPTDFIAGKMMLVRALVLGWHLDAVSPISDPLKNIETKYDFTAFVPLQLQQSFDKLYLIKKIIVGGGTVSNELIGKIQTINTAIYATYGMTETSTHIAIKKLNCFEKKNLESTQKSPYKTLSQIVISQDNRDCLVIDAPKISKNKIITNDVIRLISETEFEWLGRFDNVVNSGGIKLHPEKIEKKLSEIIVQRFFVTGVKDEFLGEKLIVLVEGKNDENLFSKIKNLKTLAKFEVPKAIYFIENFLETGTKKIQRKATLDLIF